jgi:hypothetical protein
VKLAEQHTGTIGCRSLDILHCAAAKVLGVSTQVLDIHDGELEPNLENRKTITRLKRPAGDRHR